MRNATVGVSPRGACWKARREGRCGPRWIQAGTRMNGRCRARRALLHARKFALQKFFCVYVAVRFYYVEAHTAIG